MTVISGGGQRLVQRRATRRDGWTKARRATFLDGLAATCNVARSAASAGMNRRGAYDLRRRDPGFAALWDEAIQLGYARLETELLEHALGETGDGEPAGGIVLGENPDGARAEPAPARFDPDMAVKILKMRHAVRRKGGTPGRVATIEEVDAVLFKRIAAIARRLGNDA